MIDGALPYLRCPVCEQSLTRDDRTLACSRGHRFDLAKQGYANLTAGRTPYSGDTPDMVADRDAFLGAGHYDFIAENVARIADIAGGLVVDAGTGTGHYLATALDTCENAIGLGIDVSKPALRRAARSHPRTSAVLADLWRPLPIADHSADVIIDVFAPRNGPEFRRILRPGGVLVVVTPAAEHLTELIAEHGLLRVDPDKAARVADSLGGHFTVESEDRISRTLDLSAVEARTLIGMTPNAHHVPASALPTRPQSVTAAVTITAYRTR